MLVLTLLLAYIDFSLQFEMHTDASATNIYWLFIVLNPGRLEHAIAYGGRDLSPSETKYSTTEREALAIVSDIRSVRNNLHGNKFTVHIDHNCALKWLMSIKDPNSRLVCPSLLLQQYDFAILEHCMHDASVNLQF